MNDREEKKLFKLITNDDGSLKKEDILPIIKKDGFDINKAIISDGLEIEEIEEYHKEYIISEAICNCSYELVEALIKNGAEINIISDSNPINLAITEGRLDIVKLLIDNNVDLSIKDNDGETPLVLATLYSRYDMVETILKSYKDSKKFEDDKASALFKSVRNSDYDLSKLLLENGANPNIKHGSLGMTALRLATNHTQLFTLNMKLINLLIDYDGDISSDSCMGNLYKEAENVVCAILQKKQIARDIKEASYYISKVKGVMANKPKIKGFNR